MVLETGLKGVRWPPWRVVVAMVAAVGMALSAAGCQPLSMGEADATRTPVEATQAPVKVEAAPTRPPVEGGRARAPVEGGRTGTICKPQVDRPNWLFRDFVQWTPDGSTVLFTDGSHIYAVAADGSRLWNVVAPKPPEGERGWPMAPFTISPDSEHVVYATCDYGRSYELARVRVDGTQVQRVTRKPRSFDSHPAWSPDGARIAFLAADFDVDGSTGDYPSGIRPRLYTIAPDGTDLTELPVGTVDRDTHLHYHRPQWSPDGRHLAFAKQDSWVVTALYTVAVDGEAPQRLTAAVSVPSWSPDGERLAFAKPVGDEVALYTIAADGSDARRVTVITGWHPEYGEPDPTRAWIDTVAWSPDGSKILYSCGAICVVDLDDAVAATQVTSAANTSSAEDEVHHVPKNDAGGHPTRLPGILAAWSPDGSRIALLGSRDSLATVAPDGSDVRVLVLAALGGPIAAESGYDDLESSQAACAAGLVVDAPAENPGLVRDCETLLGMRDAFFGGTLVNWGAGTPITHWLGVTVSGAPLRVTGLKRLGPASTGPLPPTLGDLTQLQILDVSRNQFSGPIPPALGDLTQLRMLDLSGNQFSGPIPPALGDLTQLRMLDLSRNQLSGPIPPELGHLTQLQVLVIQGGALTGGIPAELGQLANLRILILSENQLTGAIPAALGQLTDLLVLSLYENRLTGAIPAELGQLANLTGDVAATREQLTASLAGAIGVTRVSWNRTAGLSLHSNQLSGAIPAELGQLTQLTELDLGNNQLTGPLPPELGQMTSLRQLELVQNQLTGTIPAELGRLVNLEGLDLQANLLTGQIPAELGQLVNLRVLGLSQNLLTGPIPQELGQLDAALWLAGNRFTGCIPLGVQVDDRDLLSLRDCG